MIRVNRLISAITAILMIFVMLPGISANNYDDSITVELDGNKIDFDVNPQVVDGRTLVPLRKIFEEIGALVKWDDETQTVSARKNSKTVSLTVDTAELKIDKGDVDDEGNPVVETVTLEVPAQVVSGRTLVPARAVSEAFGLDVAWDEKKNKVIITSDDEDDDSWKENTGIINLSDLTATGYGVEISGNQIKITSGGDFTVKGTLDDGNITVSAKERVKLRLSGASITSSDGPCIFFEETDKAFITVSDDTENFLTAANSEDGAIYSKENLEIKGDGILNIESSAGHAVKASDNLTVENGTLNLTSSGDGIHINDTFKMTGGEINISAMWDGIDSESIVIISGGKLNIETKGEPIEAEKNDESSEASGNMRMRMGASAEVEFEKSSKGINAEWMMCISGGNITVDSASHAVHCEDEIQISGGTFYLSSEYEKGISAHGNLTIDNSETYIDISKSTEGIESKNVMTINDGVIRVVASDDALNATGGNSGGMMGMPMGGGMRGNGGNMPMPPEARDGNSDTDNADNGFAPPDLKGGMRPGGGRGGRMPVGNNQPPTDGESMRRHQWGGRMPMEGEQPAPDGAEMSPPPEFGRRFPMNGEMPDGKTGQPTENDSAENPLKNGRGMMPGGFGGMGRNMKDCLIINGGDIELYSAIDCIDANGNIAINGGFIKATKSNGSVSGAEAVIDPDGQVKISENASLIFATGSANLGSLGLTQNVLTVYCDESHLSGEKITVTGALGSDVLEYTPAGSYSAVLIASPKLENGKTYTVKVGDESHKIEITEQTTVIGTKPQSNNRFGGRWGMPPNTAETTE